MPTDKQNSHPHVLLTGATGFLGQAVLEQLLQHPAEPRITLIIRASNDEQAAQRHADLFDKPVFRTWKAAVGEKAAQRRWNERTAVLRDDLSPALVVPTNLTHVIHSASSVSFDEPIDSAFRANVLGPNSLYNALHTAGYSGHVIHVSTSYVQANRTTLAREESVTHDHEWENVAERVNKVVAQVHRSAEKRSRNDRWVRQQLSEQGKKLAVDLGFTDIYTATKALGERVAESQWRPYQLTVVRPTIIESAQSIPYPGWIDGFKVAEPLIAAYAKGRVTQFPGHPNNIIDIVPVDRVVHTIMLAMDTPPASGATRYLQVGTSMSTPLTMDELRASVQMYYSANPVKNSTGSNPDLDWSFRPARLMRHKIATQQAVVRFAKFAHDKSPRKSKNVTTRLALAERNLRTLTKFVSLYEPYTSSRTTYSSEATTALFNESSVLMPHMDWNEYLHEIHLPAVSQMMR